ncbi:uncharacterized protein EV420DRAFT_1480127 [Desarmillaria tabescens]|uniref:Uncharacterized protein n=1 Tax=Armillaria tabescens TaxID=1929756 RepID=A0AA39KBK2_ARMTA|nr:uncharacterized protein EV420DRAFT_1480127 [Desarmillaria tabescens]KAK0457947.1 hypothetical protein EV420DRAFT_1480127 [Desarmillaria tabescens]
MALTHYYSTLALSSTATVWHVTQWCTVVSQIRSLCDANWRVVRVERVYMSYGGARGCGWIIVVFVLLSGVKCMVEAKDLVMVRYFTWTGLRGVVVDVGIIDGGVILTPMTGHSLSLTWKLLITREVPLAAFIIKVDGDGVGVIVGVGGVFSGAVGAGAVAVTTGAGRAGTCVVVIVVGRALVTVLMGRCTISTNFDRGTMIDMGVDADLGSRYFLSRENIQRTMSMERGCKSVSPDGRHIFVGLYRFFYLCAYNGLTSVYTEAQGYVAMHGGEELEAGEVLAIFAISFLLSTSFTFAAMVFTCSSNR